MSLSRRRLLQIGMAAAISAVALVVVRLPQHPRVLNRRDVVDHLLEAFGYLHPDPQETGRFADLYLAHHRSEPGEGDLEHLEQTYLLSTDFFQSGQPPAGPVHFVQLYHPYVLPCYSPLVRRGVAKFDHAPGQPTSGRLHS